MKKWRNTIISFLILAGAIASLCIVAETKINPYVLPFVYGIALILYIVNMVKGIRQCIRDKRSKWYLAVVIFTNLIPMIFIGWYWIIMLFVFAFMV